jgi:hypothetical protein
MEVLIASILEELRVWKNPFRSCFPDQVIDDISGS